MKQSCTLALLTCLSRELRVAYILGDVFEVASVEGARICDISEVADRKRLSRAREKVRAFVGEHCGLVSPERARCHCAKRVSKAVSLGRVVPRVAEHATPEEIAVDEIETLYDVAGLIGSVRDSPAPQGAAVHIKRLIQSGRYRTLNG
ncbi:MAG: hypothetical protein ACSLFB_05640 [Acidimicrobiales bacterium]